jgi:hypothetical protein
VYLLKRNLKILEIEGPNYEDSLFFDEDGLTAIGEAKLIESSKHWSPRSLLYKGTDHGPIIQLWNRCDESTRPVLFSTIPTNDEIRTHEVGIEIQDSILSEVVDDLNERIKTGKLSGIKNDINLPNVKAFLLRTEFIHFDIRRLEQHVMHFAKTDLDGVARLVHYFNSPGYRAHSRISRPEIQLIMQEKIEVFRKPSFTHGESRIISDRTSIVEIPEIPEAQIQKVRDTLAYHSKKSLNPFAISGTQKQKRFIQEKFQENVLRSFVDACKVFSGKGSMELPREYLDAITLRAYGILFTAAATEIIRKGEKFQVTLEIDPDKIFFNWIPEDERWDKFVDDLFFDWAIRFKGLKERSYDRELLKAWYKKSTEEFLKWVSDSFDNASEITNRAFELTVLHHEQARLFGEAIKGRGENWGSILAHTIVDSYHELRKAGRLG